MDTLTVPSLSIEAPKPNRRLSISQELDGDFFSMSERTRRLSFLGEDFLSMIKDDPVGSTKDWSCCGTTFNSFGELMEHQECTHINLGMQSSFSTMTFPTSEMREELESVTPTTDTSSPMSARHLQTFSPQFFNVNSPVEIVSIQQQLHGLNVDVADAANFGGSSLSGDKFFKRARAPSFSAGIVKKSKSEDEISPSSATSPFDDGHFVSTPSAVSPMSHIGQGISNTFLAPNSPPRSLHNPNMMSPGNMMMGSPSMPMSSPMMGSSMIGSAMMGSPMMGSLMMGSPMMGAAAMLPLELQRCMTPPSRTQSTPAMMESHNNQMMFSPHLMTDLQRCMTPPPYRPSSPGLMMDASAVMNMMENCMDDEEKEKKYKCPRPHCTKIYKNSNGLKYHMEHGQCEIDSMTTADPFVQQGFNMSDLPVTHRPYWCKVPGCAKKYKNLNGLKYHVRVSHSSLDSRVLVRNARVGGLSR